eukprot:346159-Pelagomonas_calceolata.AAC.2
MSHMTSQKSAHSFFFPLQGHPGRRQSTLGHASGSVEDERMLSAMKYLRNPQSKRLKQQHLTCCAWGFALILLWSHFHTQLPWGNGSVLGSGVE